MLVPEAAPDSYNRSRNNAGDRQKETKNVNLFLMIL
jgi:hypothetical protein